MNEYTEKYFLKTTNPITGTESEWEEVTREQFVFAERISGFHDPRQNADGTATGAFSSGALRGKVVYERADDPAS